MKNKEFAIFNNINEKEANEILNWFLENFNEKDIEKVVDILIDAVKKSAATINDLYDACIEIKKISPDYDDLWIIKDLGRMANYGINAAKAGKELAKSIKKIS